MRTPLIERLFPRQFANARVEVAKQVQAGIAEAERVMKADAGTGSYYWGYARSAGGKWPGSLSNPFGGIVFNMWRARQQARDAYHDSVHIRGIVNRFADTVVDTGLTCEPEPDWQTLGITDEGKQADWQESTRIAFHAWAKSQKQHRAGMFNWYQIQRLLQLSYERDNDVYLRLYYNQGKRELVNPLQFEVIDANQIRGDSVLATQIFGKFPDGIERNADGTERSYKIWVQPANKYVFKSVDVPHVGEKSGRYLMLHGFVPEYSQQGRGLSSLTSILQDSELAQDFSLAQIKKAINQSNVALFNKPSQKSPSSNPFEHLAQSPQGAVPMSFGATPQPGGIAVNITAGSTQPASYTPMPEATFSVPGSVGVFSLNSGEELVPFASTAPSQNFDSFMDAFIGAMSTAVSMPLEVMKMKFANNYSASRATLLMFWRILLMKRAHMAGDFLDPVYEMWLSGEIASGRISCPGWQDARLRAAWCSCRWGGLPMFQIDPVQEMEAAKGWVEIGAQTLDDTAREHNGSSGKSNRAKNKNQLTELTPPFWASKITTQGKLTKGTLDAAPEPKPVPLQQGSKNGNQPQRNGKGQPKSLELQGVP